MDGTLVDTEPYWMDAEKVLVERFDGVWTHEQALALVGCGLEDGARVLQAAGVRMSEEQIVQWLTEEVMVRIDRDRDGGAPDPFRPGARELLRSLKDAGIPTALVTMSRRRMAEVIVGRIGFDAFDLVLGGDDVTRPKPYPDPYLRACEVLEVLPADVVAIEDSPNGLRSAVASGAVSLGVPLALSLEGVGAHELWPTLDGRTADDLRALHARHARKERTRA
jgi:HAD superfamily hydrolase (TIGR01509 family)